MRYEEMLATIKQAKEDYYNRGRSKLSDAEYDLLVSQAEKLGYVETVGATPVDNITKVKHDHPMLSLHKIHSEFEVKKFIRDHKVLAMYKADGLTLSATYVDGVLTKLETRGDGEVGNDILFHANSISNLPKTINKLGTYIVDGECVILYPDFETINSKLSKEDKYKTTRNLAAGSLNLLDGSLSKGRYLKFYAWDVIEGGSNNSLCANLIEANYYGFDTVAMYLMDGSETIETIKSILDNMREGAKKDGFPIDGVVFKYDDIEYFKSLGRVEHHFKGGEAYKFEDDEYPTSLINIEWNMGKSGCLTPVAIFDPVIIDGTTVNRASLSNVTVMKSILGKPYVGQKIWVKKSNMIIPQIVYAEKEEGEENV